MTELELRNELIKSISNADPRLLKILLAVTKEYHSEEPSKGTTENSDQLHRMVYTSARTKNCSESDIEEILLASRRNNAALNVSGILIHTNDRFLQILEGSKNNITELYEKIQKDDRHAGTSVRFFEPVDKREFGEWNMAHKTMNVQEIQYNTAISDENKKAYQSMMDGDLFSYKDDGLRVLKTFLLIS